MEEIKGIVTVIIFRNPENGFTVAKIKLQENNTFLSVTGILGNVCVGELLIAKGNYELHPKYGRGFSVCSFETEVPDDSPNEIALFLTNAIEEMPKNTALKIAKHFGKKTLSILENSPQRLCEINKISKEKAKFYGEQFAQMKGIRKLTDIFTSYKLPKSAAYAFWKKYDVDSINIIEKNPYVLCYDDTVKADFFTIDEIVPDKDPINRAVAVIFQILRDNALYGHTNVPLTEVFPIASENFGVSNKSFNYAIDFLIKTDGIKIIGTKNHRVFLPQYHTAEFYSANKLKEMLMFDSSGKKATEKEIAAVETISHISYNKKQRQAIDNALSQNVSILTGGPGTGKTTTINAIINILEARGLTVSLSAPTGRAARRISDLTKHRAKTLHRMLRVLRSNDLLKFMHDEENPLETEVVIVDEMSMVDILLFEALLRAIPKDCKLVLIGDSNQLPSVGAGNVLSDLMKSEKIPFTELTEIFRQAEQSEIVTNAHKIINGEYPVFAKNNDMFFINTSNIEEIYEILKNTALSYYKTGIEFQVLTPTRKGNLGTVALNAVLQETLNPPSPNKSEFSLDGKLFREGDKVIQNANNYAIEWIWNGKIQTGIFNGDSGVILHFADNQTVINFDERLVTYKQKELFQIELSYALTIHKSQGSEYNTVFLVLSDYSNKLLYRNLLYTAVTRARERLFIIGPSDVLSKMVKNNKETFRMTCLYALL